MQKNVCCPTQIIQREKGKETKRARKKTKQVKRGLEKNKTIHASIV